MSTPPLERFQQWFAEALIHDGPSDPPSTSPMLRSIIEAGPLSAAARLRIYQEAFWIRMNENLEEDYPGVRRLLGPVAFTELVRAFVTASPQPHPSLIYLGEAFPNFLAHAFPGRAELAAMARVEWAKIEVRHAEAPEVLLTGLPALAPEALFGLRLLRSPTARVLLEQHRVGSWLSGLVSEAPTSVEVGAETVAVVRQGFEICIDVISPPFDGVLGKLWEGASLAASIEGLDPGAVSLAEVSQAFAGFVQRGYFERVEL